MLDFKIHEVGLRDGLQMEKETVPFDIKLKWAQMLIDAKLPIIQLGSFVHPVKVPQMADTDKLFNYFKEIEHESLLSGLILNERGAERALDCGVELYCLGVSASRTHSKKNTGMTTEEALKRIIDIALDLKKMKKEVQVSVQSAFGCGFEGKIQKENVYAIIREYVSNGLKNISLADTAGHAYPEQVAEMTSFIKREFPGTKIALHIHNTYGLGIANCYAGIQNGTDIIETAFGGLGGCPFTKQAAGNVCTEDFIHGLSRKRDTEINIDKIIEVTIEAEKFLKKKLQGYVYKAGKIKY